LQLGDEKKHRHLEERFLKHRQRQTDRDVRNVKKKACKRVTPAAKRSRRVAGFEVSQQPGEDNEEDETEKELLYSATLVIRSRIKREQPAASRLGDSGGGLVSFTINTREKFVEEKREKKESEQSGMGEEE
jgi:hypothetical protein